MKKAQLFGFNLLFLWGMMGGQIVLPSGVRTTENYVFSRQYLEPTTSSSMVAKQLQNVTYHDGLGRAFQNISIKSTPLQKDLITPRAYDGFSRETMQFLPLPQVQSLNGAPFAVINTSNAAVLYHDTNRLFEQNVLEPPPRSRLLEKRIPGEPWENKPALYSYSTNSLEEVLNLMAQTSWINGVNVSTLVLAQSSKFYLPGSLRKITRKDQDGSTLAEFRDFENRLLLRRHYTDEGNQDTYFVYNEYGQRAFNISPLASTTLYLKAPGSVLTSEDPLLAELAQSYRYDTWGREAEFRDFGKSWTYQVFDKADRLVLSQDGELGISNKWNYYKYDGLGRLIYQGIYQSNYSYGSPGRASEQMAVNLLSNNFEVRNTTGSPFNGINLFYSTSSAYPTSNFTVEEIHYYDSYPPQSDFPLGMYLGSIEGQPLLLSKSVAGQGVLSTNSLEVAQFVKSLEQDMWQKSYFYYDHKQRLIAHYEVLPGGGYTKKHLKLNFSGQNERITTLHKRLASELEHSVVENFTYDHSGREVSHTHQIGLNPPEMLSVIVYDELGQRAQMKLGGTTSSPLQILSYKYNIHGWLERINSVESMSSHLFALSLYYNATSPTFSSNPRFNGNISLTEWATLYPNSDQKLRAYAFEYDKANRLVQSQYYQKEQSLIKSTLYDEHISYDLNGNINTLVRYSDPLAQGIAEKIDDLQYTYKNNGLSNKIHRIMPPTGVANNPKGYNALGLAYSYDHNANITSSKDTDIEAILYNRLNLPSQIAKMSDTLRYEYLADGRKLNLQHQNTGTIYHGDFLYKIQGLSSTLTYIKTSQGYFDISRNAYIYNYVDHLGSVRLSFWKNGSGTLEVLEESNYYPFGLQHEGYNNAAILTDYPYKFNGKELQVEIGMYDYGARYYMPSIGRWINVDPLAEKMPSWSPYAYAFDNPIIFTDPDGREPEHIDPSKIFEKNKDGSYKNPNLVKAWNHYATSKEGIAFLSKYAAPNQKVAGVQYGKDGGEYHNKGVDLIVGGFGLTNDYNSTNLLPASGMTVNNITQDGVDITVDILGSGSAYSNLETIIHETVIHAEKSAIDYSDNKKIDQSAGYDKDLVNFGKKNNYSKRYYDHYQERRDNKRLQIGVPIIKSFNQKNNIKKSDTDIKNDMKYGD